ncbi:uncharacterized protein LOC129831338 [Salvelinus fontinalis]|uniref:uncharacterized protein LOC129831338 n=1 Tax=Salvelinus fontinalis TaxID=8038 RepID=UPI0024850169|nr:uncharacterized protein LOC129831338 [Salvelinus fontinalis]
MDLRAKPKRFGTFTFGLKRRKKKSDGDLSQSIVVLHSPEPEVKGQEEEEPLNLSLWDIGQGGTLNKRVRFAVSQPDLNTKTLVTSYPPPTVPKKSQAQEPPMDSPKTATNQPNSQMDNIIPLEVGRATRTVPLAMPEMEWNETSQEEESPDVQCDNPNASADHTDTASLMDVDSFNPSPPPNPPLPSYPSSPPPCIPLSPPTSYSPFSSPPTRVYTSNQSGEISLSPLPSADPVNSVISDPIFPVAELSLSKAEASYVTLSIGQPVVVENISTVTPNTDPSPIALDPNIEATITETDTTVPEVKTETFPLNPDTLADNTETPILITVTSALITVNPVTDMDADSINDASVSTADTSRPMPETVTSITSEAISTAIADPGPSLAEMVIPVPSMDKSTPEMRASIANTVNFITNSDNTVPNTDTFSANTEVFGTLCDSLFPQSFTSEQESATSDNDSTEGCLDTNLPIINDVTNPHLSLDNPFDSPSPILPESVKQESETAIDHTEASAGDPTQSTPLQSATDTTASPNTNLTVTDKDSQPVFGDLSDSLFPGMFPSHHMSGHTASATSSYTSGVVTSDVTMDTRCTPTNIDTSFENELHSVPQIDTAHPSTDISLTEPEAFASLCFEPTLPTTEPMEMDDLEPELATSDSPLPNTDVAVPDTGSSDKYESLHDFIFPESFPSDQVSTIFDPVLDKPVYVTDTDSDLLRPDCNTRPNRVDQSEPLTSALPVYLDTEDTENTDPVLHHSDMNIDNSDHILSDNATLVSDILSASHPSTKNSSTRETAISIGASVSSTIAETMATETGQEAEVQIMEEEKGQIEENIMSYDVDLVREISNDMFTMVTEKVQEAEVEIMEEANSIDSNRQIKEHMPCDAEVNKASSQHVIIPENSNAMEVAIPAVHYSILEDYMEESGVEEVKSEEMKGRGQQWRNGNGTVEVGWSLGSQKVTEVMLETKDRGQENEVHREEKRHIESPEDSDAERLVLVEERGAREVSSLVKEEWEDGVEPALPVQQVHTLMECESPAPPSITEQHGEEEGSGSNRSAVTHAYLVTEARADTHTLRQTPGHEEPQESHSAENKHAATDNRERQDTLATHNTLAHTTDREGSVSDTHTVEKVDLVTRTTEDTSSFSEQKATINTTSTHGENTFTLDREETATDTESKTHTGKIEHKGTLGTEWIDSIVTQGTDRSSSEPVPEQVAVNPPVTRDTVLDRLRKRANGLATEDTERPGAEPEQVGGKLSVTADTLLHSLRNRVKFLSQPEGSLDASAVLSAALEDSEDSDSEIQQIVADLESDSEMKSYSSTLTLRPSPTHKGVDKSKQGFRKVSLVTDNDTTDHTEDSVDYSESTINDPNRTESDLGQVAPEYKWRNLYEGVQTTFEPTGESWRSDSQSDESRVSTYEGHYSSLSPSLSVYTLTSHGPPFQEPGLSSLSSETPRSPGNGRGLSDRSEVQLTRESSEPEAGTGRGSRKEWEEELATAPAGRREREVEQEGREGESMARKIKSGCDLQSLPVSNFSSAGQTIDNVDYSRGSSDSYSGQYKATRVDLLPSPSSSDPSPSSSPVTPDPGSPYNHDIESLVDTLKSMNLNLPQRQRRLRGTTAPSIISSLPSIEEDTPSSSPTNTKSPQVPPGSLLEGPNSRYNLPADLGLNWSTPKEMHSPLELMKLQQQLQQEQQAGDHHWNRRGLNLPLRASALSSIVMRKSSLGSDSSPEHSPSPLLNGGSSNQSPNPSRLDRSLLYSSYRSASIDQPQENGKAHSPGQRPSLFRTGSLTDIGPNQDHMSSGPGMGMAGGPGSGLGFESGVGTQTGTGTDPSTHFRYDRFSSRMSDSLTGNNTDTNSRMSRPPPLPSFTSTREGLLSPTSSSLDIHRSFANANESALKLSPGLGGMSSNGNAGSVGSIGLGLQRNFSNEGLNSPLFNMGSPHGGSPNGGSHFSPEAEKNLVPKYRAFPDAYLTKEKEHGKLNPRPGKMFIFDRPGMCGQRMEVWSDVVDATPWQLQETISIRVVRGGWVLHEKPNFKGEKIALDEGDIELTYPFDPPEEVEGQQQQNGEDSQKEGGEEVVAAKPARRFIIGSVRRVVRDYSVPEISLFPEENAEGKKVTFRDTSDDARIFGFPIKANSIIINAGLWLVYAQPFFQGVPRVLEVGGFPNPAAWGVEQPYVGSVHPLKIGEPRVEKPGEPKLVLYEKPYFTGKTRTIYTNMRDFMTRKDRQQTAFMYSPGSIKVQGGCWVGYEKEGFRGHQYMLEEGEYHDWRVWGGCDAELRSVRVIRADLTEPMLVLYEQPDVEQEVDQDNTFEVTEAIPDVELFGFRTTTRSIHVVSGAWIAYSHVDFSGDQYVLEKGFYSNSADWGSSDNRICSVQPILQAPSENEGRVRSEVMLYTEPDFQGECHVCDKNQESLSDKLIAKSCRVVGGSWVVYEGRDYSGNLYILSEGDYPNFTSMGCPPNCVIRSLKTVPLVFSVPSVSLFGLECLEGREITVDTEVANMLEEGYNNHLLSVRVNRGCWVMCEHSNYRGRQFLLEPIEISNWPKFSQLLTIGSMHPVRQRRHFFRIKSKERGHFLSIQGGVEEMMSGRVVVTEQVEGMSEIWFYQEGLIKNKLAPTMSLQVMGNVEAGAKVVLWSETRQPVQTWSAQMRGTIPSLTFPGMVLDIKGGKQYDRDHVVILPESEERPCQQWELELL